MDTDGFAADLGPAGRAELGPSPPGGLLDVLGVAAIVLDADGRIVFWSPQAQALLGYSAQEALGRYAARLLVADEHVDLVLGLFAQVMEGEGTWAGVFPVRHRDGRTRLLEFRNMRLLDDRGDLYALGLATDQATLQRVERDLALSVRLVDQSPIGLAVMDTDLRYVMVNPALERINGLPAEDHLGRSVHEALPLLDADPLEAGLRQVLATGVPLLDQYTVGRTRADPGTEHAWSVSCFRLEDGGGKVLGVATSSVDVTDRHRAALEAERARHRLAVVADASVRIGTTLDLEQTARELADVAVPELADMAAVDLLDAALAGHRTTVPSGGPALFRALAVAAAYPTEAASAADAAGEIARYDADRLVTRCVNTSRPVMVPHVGEADLSLIARDPRAAALMARAGVHSYLAVPLIARGEVIGALDLVRARNAQPFTDDDATLASELAARAAVCIDNARWYQQQRDTALTLQRSLLPEPPPRLFGLEVASRYQPAGAASEVGGDWYDILPLPDHKTALVVGDVMGSGIKAATTMGRLRTATQTLAGLGLEPTQVLLNLDRITAGLDPYFATCTYALYDPHSAQCRISTAGHLPPVRMRPGHDPELLDLPTGAPLGVGGVPFRSTAVDLDPGDQLVLYTDGLVETRDQDIDTRLDALVTLLGGPHRALEYTCDHLLAALRHPDDHDDVALLIARVRR
ncbi:PAS sensor protein [Streptomyces agglomeratus]|uniref:protein-serine/threonine phosphatase n=1 Tax=Streptomyces agglomeratus TaxID=285458 RepID=A0A1E5PFP4_9ACTN|nr:SpoIIE family protein phosphatase [Streptomyces agglomeratus]OEJ28315.1 PAS sensor protein [Streptomyces agglomeratus]OEJ37620.1 PAS sensor protein [Streptomyces agglomeratus]OEJ47993.1 PAS sensor protein [Streptomyces agglomeratus]OEJ50159.1 PAS sensor protein [Streptomyces agglomeratus]OEJ57488.1 PAS sensor protein [Streptomyces agglomeratus]